ncbi:MAG: HupE/UreJ family protein, partial [Luteimonas sp.]
MSRRIAVLIALLFAGCALPAPAHTLSVAHVGVVLRAQGPAQVEVDIALRDIALTFALDADRDDSVTWGELSALRAPLTDWVIANINLSTPAGNCALTPTGLATRRYDGGGYATVQLSADCPSTAPLKVRYGLLFDRDPQHRALITVRQGDLVQTAIARADLQTVTIGAPSSNAFVDFLREGIHHILIGYDHLAFLISLLLTAALVRVRRGWEPVSRRRDSLGRTLGIVTAFT